MIARAAERELATPHKRSPKVRTQGCRHRMKLARSAATAQEEETRLARPPQTHHLASACGQGVNAVNAWTRKDAAFI